MKIIKAPNPILKKKTKDVKKIDAEVSALIDNMFTALEKLGVGLAAPQVGKSLNLAVIGFKPTDEQLKENPDLTEIPKLVLINPKICWKSKDIGLEKERCISVENLEISVPRNKKIHLEYQDEEFKKSKIKARGYLARIIQHEIDHLNGKLISDYK